MASEKILTEGLEEITTEDSETLMTEGEDNPYANDYGLKITKKGKSIDSTDPRDYVLWSKYPVLKIAQYGGGTFDLTPLPAGNGGLLTINHDLGYNPIVFFFKKKITTGVVGPDSGKMLVKSNYQDSFAFAAIENSPSDKNNIYVQFGWDAFTPPYPSFKYYYYLCYDEGINI